MVASDFHFYGIDAGDFQSSVNQYHQIVNMPIWITELGCHVGFSRFVFSRTTVESISL